MSRPVPLLDRGLQMTSRIPPELERYTLSPNWLQDQQDEKRRRKAVEELRSRTAAK